MAAACSLGASAVQLDVGADLRLSELSATAVRQLRKMVSDFDLRIAAIGFQTRHGYAHLEGLSRRVDATKSVMKLAYQLGAPLVINQIGEVPESTTDQRYLTLAEVIGDLGRFGTRVGTLLAAETGTEPAARLAQVLGGDEHGFVAAALNPGKLIVNRFGCDDAVSALRERIQIVIASDGVLDLAEGRGLQVPLGQGTADYPSILAELQQRAFSGPLVVGDRTPGQDAQPRTAAAIQYLQNL